jgi:CubicO group peptidase (beta-lactamase class C family)
MRQRVLLAAAFLFGAARIAPAATLPADTAEVAAFGPTFNAPKAWSIATTKTQAVMTAPEGNLRLAIVDAGAAADAGAAVQAAWRAYRPGDTHKLKVTAPAAAREGWDEKAFFEYETSPNEHLLIQAVAFRKAKAWTVLIIDGSQSTEEKRDSAVGLVVQSLRPAGYARESFAGKTPHPMDAARLAALRAFVLEGMQKLRVPGVGYAVIDHGKLVYEGGAGVRELGKPAPVDAHTLFMIASNTKGLTTLLLAKLVDEGKLGWDQKVTQVYPAFRLGSDATTGQVLIRHLICACTGVPRRDLEWLFNTQPDTPASDTFRQLADTEPTSKFGEVFQYSNLMASAAGYIAGHVAHPDMELGAAYDAAMQEDVFGPLGMTQTTFDFARALAGDHAMPHADTIDGKQVVASMDVNYTIIPFRPAGAAWSSVDDMIKYVQDELTPGRLPDGRQFISAKNVLARRVPNVPLGEDASYGMGLITDRQYGVTVVQHGGHMLGFHTDWFAITDADVGAVVLTNGDNGWALRGPFGRRLLELLYDGKPDAEKELAANAAQIDAEIAKERPYLQLPADAALAAKLAPHYSNPSLGEIRVTRAGDRVVFDFGSWKSEMASRRNDDGTVSFVTTHPGVTGSAFVMTTAGGKRALVTRDGQHAYTYIES